MRSLTRGAGTRVFDWWPSLGWWPDRARDLLGGRAQVPAASATFALPARAESVHTARAFTTGTLRCWDLGHLADGVSLVVSELATNALRHGIAPATRWATDPIRLSLVRRGPLLTCAIADPGRAVPVMRDSGPLEPGGLGLHIVDSLSVRWGWSPIAPYGKAVWAVLDASAPGAGTAAACF